MDEQKTIVDYMDDVQAFLDWQKFRPFLKEADNTCVVRMNNKLKYEAIEAFNKLTNNG